MCVLLNVCVHAGYNPPSPDRSGSSTFDPCKIRQNHVTTPQNRTILTGKNGTKMEVISTTETETGRAAEPNVMKENPGPKSYANRRNFQTIAGTALTFFVVKSIVDTDNDNTQIDVRSKSDVEN